MLIVLSHFTHKNDQIERAVLGDRGELYVQPAATAAQNPLPKEVRAKADAVLHFAANTNIDGPLTDYPRVRAVLRSGVGFDRLDLAGWGRRGVPVFNVPDYGTSEVADHAIALMLALLRGTSSYHDAIRSDPKGNWTHAKAPVVRRIRGCVFGVVGLGRIGLAAATRARAFGMEIAFFDPYLPSGMEIAVGARRCATLHELMSIADVVSIHAPSNEETRGLIDAAAFRSAKKGMTLINTARGAIVDLDALHEAMKARHVAAAGLDVLPQEPADARHPLISAFLKREPWIEGRLTLSPHAAFYSPASVKDMRRFGIETLIACLERGSLANCVNLHLLKRAKA